MVKFINKTTGSEMWVAEDRVEEYKAAGHRLVASAPKPVYAPAEQPKIAAKKKTKK